MPIQFNCPQCNRLLSVPDTAAGKQAKCPGCTGIITVPNQSAGSSDPLAGGGQAAPGFGQPSPGYGQPSPQFGQKPGYGPAPAQNPFGEYQQQNPYSSPTSGYQTGYGQGMYGAPQAQPPTWKVIVPAVGMLAGGGLSLAYSIFNTIVVMAQGGADAMMAQQGVGADPAEQMGFMVGFYGALCGIPLVSIIIVICSILMLTRKSYGASLTACIVSLLPCQVCCLLTLPFGIWGLISLQDQQVKAMFQ